MRPPCSRFILLEAVVLEDEHVGALEAAVDDPLDVEVLEAARDVVQHGRLLLGGDGAAAHHVVRVQQVEEARGRALLDDAQAGPHRAGS